MALVGSTYIQASSSDPGAVGFGYSWAQTDTGVILYRNTSNTAWVTLGATTSTNLGLTPKSGATMVGALTGAHGLMPVDASVNFTGLPHVAGSYNSDVALVTDLTTLQTGIDSQISAQVQQALASLPSVGLNSNICHWSGTAGGSQSPANTTPVAIPITGTYADGSSPIASECIVFASASTLSWPSPAGGAIACYLQMYNSDPLQWLCYTFEANGSGYTAGIVNYTVIAIKQNA